MKRSMINTQLERSVEFFRSMNFHLPPWGYWGAADWKGRGEETREIVRCRLGWDITDFGSGSFDRIGLTNFNLRNGVPGSGGKTYCEKILIVHENQVTPLHTHRLKSEDIINRGGGNLVIELFDSEGFQLTRDDVTVEVDAIPRTVSCGGAVVLKPGESILLTPGVFHLFYGEAGTGSVLVGEVSTVNDDSADNVFAEERPRFPRIEEDSAPLHLLVNDYESYL